MISDGIVSPKSSEKLDENEINTIKIYDNNIKNIDKDNIKNNKNNLTFISEKKHPYIFNNGNSTSNFMKLNTNNFNNNENNKEKNIIISFRDNNKNDILNSSFKTASNGKKLMRNFMSQVSSNIIKRFLSEGNENNNEDHSIIVINENCFICDEKLTQHR